MIIIKIYSPAFKYGARIPKKYTCDGININPPLKILDVPRRSKSLVIIVDDIDAPRGIFYHWLMWNINPIIKNIREGYLSTTEREGVNSFGNIGYDGPCPPRGDDFHRYRFISIALDDKLNLKYNIKPSELYKEIKKHYIISNIYMGVYKR